MDILNSQEIQNNTDSSAFDSGARAQLKPLGSSGTELFAGYFSEEYLQQLRGKMGAKVFDEIRRSEPQVTMLLNAVMNPIKAGVWEFEAPKDLENGELHKEFLEFNAKDCIDWETHLHEALTFLIYGFSLFETIHGVIYNHEKFGTVNVLKALAYRSQKTIERWIVESGTGELKAVEQWAFSDTAPSGKAIVQMDARFLLPITLQKEGDNYEGISALRPMYGPWFRKNLYLKIAAIGAEKSAIGTPIGKIPTGKLSQDEIEKFKNVLSNFTAHESAFIMVPQGWEVEIVKNDFDADKIEKLLRFENQEMVNSLVANFLVLGMGGGGGSYALGTDLSDFFLTGIQNFANLICGVWNRKLIPNLIKLNYGPQKEYPKLKATGINDKAGKELAEVISSLIGSKAIRADMKLEEFLRKQFSLPQVDEATIREITQPQAQPFQFTETRIQLSEKYKTQWKKDKDQVKSVMQSNLKKILDGYKPQIQSAWKLTNKNQRRNAALELSPKGVSSYENELREILAQIANDSLIQAQKETKQANKKKIKLSETIQLAAPKGGYFNALPSAIKNIVKNQAALIVQSQTADLNKLVSFQFLANADATENADQVIADVESVAIPVIEDGATGAGMSLEAAAGNSVSTMVNQARLEWFFEPEVLETIESFTFVNEDPVSEICQELDGTTWAVGDPDIDRYTPPLHHNCKSRLQVNEKGVSGNPEITRGGTPVSEKALKSMTLHEGCCNQYGLTFKLGKV